MAPEVKIRGYTIEWAEPDYFILSRREVLYKATSLDGSFVRLGAYPCTPWKNGVAKIRLCQRLFRHMYYNVLKLPDGCLFLTFGRSIGLYANGNINLVDGLVRPCRVLRSGCAVDQNGTVFFGEYLGNEKRDPVSVYRYIPGSSRLELAYTFPAGSIRHVHGIFQDPYTAELWCVTGDRGQECRVLRTVDSFRNLEIVGEGDETWRCVGLLFTQDAIYYATDAEFQTNRIFRIDRKSGRRDEIGSVDGPVYYSYILGNDLFFGVSAELCPWQKGPVHKGRSASLWHVSEDGQIHKLLSFEKDLFSVRYFMPGTLHFPNGPGQTTKLYIQCVGLKGADNLTYRIRRKTN